MTLGVLVLDFDGTVCLGDDPMLAYAREVAVEAGDAGPAIVARVMEFLLDGDHREEPELMRAADGYQAAARLGHAAGLDLDQLNEAYRRSRVALHAGDVPVHAPEGIRELLEGLRPQIATVLVTNAPDEGLHRVLGLLGIDDVFDEVHGDANKPDGMTPILEDLMDRHRLDDPRRMLSVGDIWRNDLEPAQRLGARTALIDRWARGSGTPDHRASSTESLYPAIEEWALSIGRVNPE
jgi:FMN phosphatase YigB (HAD superfamily)